MSVELSSTYPLKYINLGTKFRVSDIRGSEYINFVWNDMQSHQTHACAQQRIISDSVFIVHRFDLFSMVQVYFQYGME